MDPAIIFATSSSAGWDFFQAAGKAILLMDMNFLNGVTCQLRAPGGSASFHFARCLSSFVQEKKKKKTCNINTL